MKTPLALLATASLLTAAERDASVSGAAPSYAARLRVPASLEPILRHVEPGKDAFPEEKITAELQERLAELSRTLRAGRPREAALLLAPEFRGGRLRPADEEPVVAGSLEVSRARTWAAETASDRSAIEGELQGLVRGMDEVRVAELLITGIEVPSAGQARTQVRYDIVGSGAGAWRAERVGRWRIDWLRGADGAWRIVEWVALDEQRSQARAPVFREVTRPSLGANRSFGSQLGFALDPWLARIDSSFMLDSMGHHGVSAGDADGDGLDDLYVAQPAGLPNLLFRNRGDGSFEDLTEAAGLAVLDETSQSLFADVDNDGDQDLVVVVTGSGLLLFVNDGKGRFTLAKDAFRFKLEGTPMSVAMADYDRDGFLDVYLCTYSYFVGTAEDKGGSPNPYHDSQNGPPNVLLRNDGRGRFTDVTKGSGLDENNTRFSFAAAWADYDEDGWPDLFVANDFGRKNLYRNEGMKDGRVRFKDVTAQAGVEDHGAGMSAAFLDFDGDGRLDLYAGNMWTANGQRITALPGFMPEAPAAIKALYRRHTRGNSLFRNRGDGSFEDVTLAAHAEMGRWAWASDALDFDSDGSPDLYVVNGMFTRWPGEQDLDAFFWRQVASRSPIGHATGTPYDDAWRAINRLLADSSQASHERNVLLRNDGKGRFDEVSGSVGLDLDQDGRSFAVLDYDGDGDPDLAVMAARSAPQLRILRNDFEGRGSVLAVRLSGTKGNRDAVGARVTVETELMRRTRVLQAGCGFISQHSKELLFGLGKSQKVLKVEVRWPSGATQVVTDVAPGQRIHIGEGGEPRREPLRAASAGEPGASTTASTPSSRESPRTSNWLYEPYPAPDFTLATLGGATLAMSSLRGRPALLLLWSPESEPSRSALRALAAAHARLSGAGASLAAVALDGTGHAAKVRAAVQGAGAIPVGMAPPELGTTYALLNRYLVVTKEDLHLPTLLLLDSTSNVVKLYRDRIDVDELLSDVAAIDAAPAERLRRAFPFAGTLYSTPGQRNSLQFGLELAEQGLEGPALVAFEKAARGGAPNAFTLYSLGTLYMKRGQADRARASFARALEVKPDFAEASNSLGALMGQGGDLPGAIARFRIALESTPDYPDALNNLGYALMQSNLDGDAYQYFQKALKVLPDFPEAYNNLGIYSARQGDPPKSEAYFRQAVEKRPSYGEAGNNLALVLMAKQDVAGATAVLQRLLQENPDFEMAYVTLARVYASTGRPRDALSVVERLLQRNPSHPLGLQLAQELKAQR